MLLTDRQLRALAYALADEIETRARQLMAQSPDLSLATAIDRAMEIMTDRLENGR
jgi:hypothetical protein